jgi:hypothetical protein
MSRGRCGRKGSECEQGSEYNRPNNGDRQTQPGQCEHLEAPPSYPSILSHHLSPHPHYLLYFFVVGQEPCPVGSVFTWAAANPDAASSIAVATLSDNNKNKRLMIEPSFTGDSSWTASRLLIISQIRSICNLGYKYRAFCLNVNNRLAPRGPGGGALFTELPRA